MLKPAQAGPGIDHFPGGGGPNRGAGGHGEIQALAGPAKFPGHGAAGGPLPGAARHGRCRCRRGVGCGCRRRAWRRSPGWLGCGFGRRRSRRDRRRQAQLLPRVDGVGRLQAVGLRQIPVVQPVAPADGIQGVPGLHLVNLGDGNRQGAPFGARAAGQRQQQDERHPDPCLGLGGHCQPSPAAASVLRGGACRQTPSQFCKSLHGQASVTVSAGSAAKGRPRRPASLRPWPQAGLAPTSPGSTAPAAAAPPRPARARASPERRP